VFVGRQAVVKNVLTIAMETGQEREGIPGNTTVITGAPGAGKSSVLSELEIRAPQAANARVVNISSAILEDSIPDITRAIAFTASSESKQWFDIWSRIGSEWVHMLPHMKDIKMSSYGDLPTLQRELPPSMWKSPVIVAVDEAQNLREGKDGATLSL